MHNIRMPKQTGMQKGLTYVLRGLTLIMLPIASSVPSVSILQFVIHLKNSFNLDENFPVYYVQLKIAS